MSEIDVSLTETLDNAFNAGLEQLAGPMPAIVNAYRAVAGQPPVADVQPTINLLVKGQPVDAPLMLDVPVAWPGDGATFAITWPLVPGSLVGLVPQGVDISQWYSTGTIGLPPTDSRRFSLSDSVVVPQPPWRATPANATDPAAMVLFAALLKLGDASASDFVALASLVLANDNDIVTQHNLHIHPTPSGPSSPPTVPMTAAAPVAASKVMAK